MENVKMWIDEKDVEQSAIDKIKSTAIHPRLFKHVAIMPDVHYGIGCNIGSVIPIKNALIPSAVGVDIGCGMCAVKTNLKISDFDEKIFKDLHHNIKRSVPVGRYHRGEKQTDMLELDDGINTLIERYQKLYPKKSIKSQLGTLGGGNHFIELQVDKDNTIWTMIHSGSRNIGKLIAEKYMKIAKEYCHEDTPDDMEYLDMNTKWGKDYYNEMTFALLFAKTNRDIMLGEIQSQLARVFPDITYNTPINIHHNYAAEETHFGENVWIHRKGATSAKKGEIGIIPGSMGSSSYIVMGKGNPDSYNSCSHGAGRLMSRNAARGKIDRKHGGYKTEGKLNMDDFVSDMSDVYSKDIDREHLDEAPRAYKNIDKVMENQKDLVDIVVRLRPIFNIKG